MRRNTQFVVDNNAKPVWHPMAHPADMRDNPPTVIVAADGVHVTDVNGHRVLDGVGGLWNVNLGYSCEPIKAAISRQLDVLPYYSGFRGTSTDTAIELAHELVEFFAPEAMVRTFFTSGGSDSVESALRISRQYWKVRGQRDRTKFIGLKRGYHGTHFGAASVNGNANFRRNYEPLLPGVFHIPSPFTYRNPFGEPDPVRLARLCANALEDEIVFQGPDTVAAFIMEPVLGAGGVIVPPETFMPLVRQICDKYEILLIADEVITGFGRTGAWTGSRLWGVKPDMMTIAKAVTNGYFPLGAAMISEKVAQVMESNTDSFGAIYHGYTYSGHPVGCAAGLATLEETARLKVNENAAARGITLADGIAGLMARHEIVGDVRSQGLMAAIELVSDRTSKTPVDKKTPLKIADAAFKAGVMIRVSGNTIILSPPLIVTDEDVKTMIDAVDAALASVRPESPKA
ncbi:MAG: aminotransferase class III-fold pyridoxal phosphate-dependent enzyme [Burkholderiaceae bacterium]